MSDDQQSPVSDYLTELTWRLTIGAARLEESRRRRHLEFFQRAQRDDGGFPGRDLGASDLYYTGFGVRALAVLGGMTPEAASHVAGFLRQRLAGKESIVDLFSLIYAANIVHTLAEIDVFGESRSDWRDAISGYFSSLRREDGGYAKGSQQ